jgi:hypothetical protein
VQGEKAEPVLAVQPCQPPYLLAAELALAIVNNDGSIRIITRLRQRGHDQFVPFRGRMQRQLPGILLPVAAAVS